MTGIFLSYARKDDEPFVKQLYENLTENGFEVWWDRKRMPSRGQSFLRELRSAGASYERLILVIGPYALKSKVVSAELGNALRDCKIVIPILRIGEPERLPEILPEKIRNFHCPDFRESRPLDEALAELHRILREEAKPLGQPLGVPTLPDHYLPRAEETERLLKSVLADDYEPIVVTSARQTVALQGMGGVGKSVLAAALAWDCEVRRAFGDGLLWVTVGQQSEAIDNFRRVGRLLKDGEQDYLDLQRAEAHLSDVLKDKHCLLILDDVWNLKQIDAFRSALVNTDCRLLITTREGEVVNVLSAQPHRIDILSDEQALRLLANWAGQLIGNLPPQAAEVADECGNLPFALALCGAMVKAGNRWEDLRDKLRAADLTFIEQQLPDYPYKDVQKSLKVSIDALDQEDQERDHQLHARQHYFELSAFQPDAAIPETAIATLWQEENGLDDASARKLISILESKALLRAEGEILSRRISLHDLQHDYMRAVLCDLKPQHQKLLEAYQRKSPNGWTSGPNDGYFYGHLVYHLLEAGRAAELHELLAGETAEGRNAWYEAKESKSDLASYMADVRRAWQQAEDDYLSLEDRQKASNIGQQVRYALIVSSLNSVAENIPTGLLEALVKTKFWSARRAIAFALQIPDEGHNAATRVQLFPYAEKEERERWFLETMGAIRKISDEAERGRLMSTLVKNIPDPKPAQMIQAVLAEIRAFKWGENQASSLSELAPFLTTGLALEALPIAQESHLKARNENILGGDTIIVRRAQIKALIEIAHRLPKAKRAEVIRETVWDAEDEGLSFMFADALAAIGKERWPKEYEPVLRTALESARADENIHFRAIALAELIPLIAPEEQEPILIEALAAISVFGDPDREIRMVSTLMAQVAKPFRRKMLDYVDQLKDDYQRNAIKARVAQLFSKKRREALLAEVLEEARLSGSLSWTGELLQKAAPHLPPKLKKEALELVFSMKGDAYSRLAALVALIPAFSDDEPEREAALRKATGLLREVKEWHEIKGALELLAPHLSAAFLEEALAKAQAIGETDIDRQIYGMDVFGTLLPDALREECFSFILKRIGGWDSWRMAQALAEMAKDLPRSLVKDALVMARGIVQPLYRVNALTGLAPILSGEERDRVLGEAKAAADAIEEAKYHADALATMAAVIEPEKREPIVKEGLALVGQVKDENLYADALIKFTPFVEEAERDRILEEAYEKARFSKYRDSAIKSLAPQLPEKVVRLALRSMPFSYDAYDMGEILPSIGLRLIDFGEYDSVYRAFMKLERNRIEALVALARRLPLSMLEQAVKDARQIDSGRREEILSALSIRFAELGDRDEALKIARQLEEPVQRAEAFAGIVPQLEDEKCEEDLLAALESVFLVEGPRIRGRILKELSPQLIRCDKNRLYKMFRSMLSYLSTRTRFQAIPELYMFSPVIAALGGEEAVGQTWHAIRHVYRWWS
jgi:hypothetical protein